LGNLEKFIKLKMILTILTLILPLYAIYAVLNHKHLGVWLSITMHVVVTHFLLFFPGANLYYLNFDILAVLFISLTSLITFLCIVYIYDDVINYRLYTLYILLTEVCLIFFFSAAHFGVFFAAFEGVLIPLALIIGTFGTRKLRLVASLQLFYYTLLGSFLMLLSFYYIYLKTGSLHMSIIPYFHMDITTECCLWIALFIPLAIKTPLYPFHVWLPQAHVEAPTVGSVLLAALVLKMGGFGFIRILLPLCPRACMWFSFFVFSICIIGGSYAAFTAASQTDLKRIIAASSIVHMSYSTIGVFNMDLISVVSAIFAMFAHGLISAGLFFAIGCIYSRYGERDLSFYTSLFKKCLNCLLSFYFILFQM